MKDAADLQTWLAEQRRTHGVVGASVGILHRGQQHIAADGLLNLDTGVEATAESVFQIGSIGKLFTAVAVMQLVADKRLDLDAPVRRYLPDLAVADARASAEITTRQLLMHTSGMDGDFFPADDLQGPSVLSYVHKMRLLPQLYAPGQGPMTYCNAGYVLLGRLVEVLTGLPWEVATEQLIFEPLGLQRAFTRPAEGLRHRCAMGHMAKPDAPRDVFMAPVTYLQLSAGPAGSAISMDGADLLRFAQAFLGDGNPDLLPKQVTQEMWDSRIELPPHSRPGFTHWGLGWMIGRHADHVVVGHDGGTLGQYAYLRIYPEHDTAFALLTNSPSAALFEAVERHVRGTVLGLAQAPTTPTTASTQDTDELLGRYSNIASTYTVSNDNGALMLRVEDKVFGSPELRAPLALHGQDCLRVESEHPALQNNLVFLRDANGKIEFLRSGLRMFRPGR